MKQRPWSKLQKEIYLLISPDINFQIHCAAYPMRSQSGSANLPRYWITLGKEIIWDYPKDFVTEEGLIKNCAGEVTQYYPYLSGVADISNLIREYIDTPKEQLLDKQFMNDKWGLVNILRAADRRIGARRLDDLKRKTHNVATIKVIMRRRENQIAE
ncbi:hypothetical protein SOASR030_03890 [Leminorella grimontii]|uniref:Uncharacterized protein n=1 Tax=Leminorella grimontii TaxID=82981 RepID=A0AAV5MXT9_9GAMM|nr:hypothetical protein [Leminorella grimontii]KFC96526.1 hypothetical protein GLGR_1702 [Leminorella grimontii ATCC 33999 = DSM 5078]GKX54277.1 hypothetical protein SOASR030_03890 [Leminorella grimontii]VFS59617.1 Uncharacterised protein [Leminorella grimontii]